MIYLEHTEKDDDESNLICTFIDFVVIEEKSWLFVVGASRMINLSTNRC